MIRFVRALCPCLVIGLWLSTAPARAVINPCHDAIASEGAACSGSCALGGTCQAGVCAGGTLVQDGTLCASGDPCTLDDRCAAGECVAGSSFTVCPPSPCGEMPLCRRDVGCVYKECPDPDAGVPDAGEADAGEPDAGELDAGEPDAGVPDAGEVDGGPVIAEPGWTDIRGSGCGSVEASLFGLSVAALLAIARRRRSA